MRVVEDPLNRETIQAITQLIVQRFHPEQIILFGNCARADQSEIKTDLPSCRNHTDTA